MNRLTYRRLTLFAAAGVMLRASHLHAQTSLTLIPTQWNTIYSLSPTFSDGDGYHMFVGGGRESLVDFDLSQIPANAVIDSVSLSMYMDRSTASGSAATQPIFIYRLTSSWGMGTSGAGQVDQAINGGGGTLFAASQNDATWDDRFYNASNPSASIPWNSAGGDYVASASAYTQVGTGIPATSTPGPGGPLLAIWSGSGLISDVQDWVAGTSANDGWILTDYASPAAYPPSGNTLGSDAPRRFISAANDLSGTNGNPNDLPELSITYTVQTTFTPLTINGQTMVAPYHGDGSAKNNLYLSSLNIAGSASVWSGVLDLTNNDMIVRNGSLGTITNQVKEGYANGSWQGSGGIVSNVAAADSTHLTALGVIQNSVNQAGGSILKSSFDGQSVINTDILVKYTYYGDANLDGAVDGSDYSQIDNSFNHEDVVGGVPQSAISGWFNGDFNYDGVVDGSDYTLIDNSFNNQTAQITAAFAATTAQIAPPSTVPEPETIFFLLIGAVGVLSRRHLGVSSTGGLTWSNVLRSKPLPQLSRRH
jgi:hypothetical protein